MRSRLVLLLLLALGKGQAATTTLRFDAAAESGSPPAAAVTANGQVVLKLRHARPAVALQLAELVARRLMLQALAGAAPHEFALHPTTEGPSLRRGDSVVATATPTAAKLAGLTPQSLAASWLKAVRQAFAGPYLTVPEAPWTVAVGESLSQPIGGQPSSPPEVVASDPAALSAVAGATSVTVTGKAVGSYNLTIRRGTAALTVPVEVRRRAGRIEEPVRITLAGRPAAPAMVTAALANALARAAVVEPGAQLRFDPPAKSGGGLVVSVRIEGGGCLPYVAALPVGIDRLDWADQPADWLLVSNAPESVTATGLLFRGRLPARERARFLYHHLTAAAVPLTFETRLVNPADTPARVLLRDASAGPSIYAELAGHLAAKRYWEQRLAQQGYVLVIPPRTSWTIGGALCRPRETFSGLSELVPLDNELELQMVATSGEPQPGSRPAVAVETPLMEQFRFAAPDQRGQYRYEPGGMHAFINIGREPLKSLAGPPLLGNYGAVYDVALEYLNSTAAPGRYELVFSADGGAALGTLVIDGRLYETKLVRGAGKERLLEFSLPPGGRRELKIRILPESGSNYPLRLVGRPFTPGLPGRTP